MNESQTQSRFAKIVNSNLQLRGSPNTVFRNTNKASKIQMPIISSFFVHHQTLRSKSLKHSQLGKSDLNVSAMCLGTNNFGAQVQRDACFQILNTACDLGINTIDTANTYTKGISEEIIGEWAVGRRSDVIIATKSGMEPPEDTRGNPMSKANVLFQIESSLKRLKTDYIDLYYVHQFDPQTPLEETLGTLNVLVREGKIRHVACSNFSAGQVSSALDICAKEGYESFIANQIRYNILQREAESETIPFCSSKSIGIIAYSPLRAGLLAGRYEKGAPPPPGSRASFRGPEYMKRIVTDENLQRLEKLKAIASESKVSLPVLAVSWILKHEAIQSVAVGASSPEQLRETSLAAEVKLSTETFDRINSV